jgi:hypothetical protein
MNSMSVYIEETELTFTVYDGVYRDGRTHYSYKVSHPTIGSSVGDDLTMPGVSDLYTAMQSLLKFAAFGGELSWPTNTGEGNLTEHIHTYSEEISMFVYDEFSDES